MIKEELREKEGEEGGRNKWMTFFFPVECFPHLEAQVGKSEKQGEERRGEE